uniref:Homeobox KN domain-containing protein n=1 Tax=Ditylenchus dipsaci TaxID=166011 RepID=A0A915EG39_9BILA
MKRKSNNLYPSRQDKLQIAKELGTSLDQINRLLANHRRRQLKNQSKKLQNTQQQTLLASPSFANDKENRQQQFPFAQTSGKETSGLNKP